MAKLSRLAQDSRWSKLIDEALDLFWDPLDEVSLEPFDKNIEAISRRVSNDFIWFDFEFETNKTLAELLLDTTDEFSEAEQHFLNAMRGTMLRLYEVDRVWPGQEMSLRDISSKNVVRVAVRRGSPMLPRGMMLAARILAWGVSGHPEVVGDTLLISALRHQALLEELKRQLKAYLKLDPDISEQEHWAAVVPLLHAVWRAPIDPSAVDVSDRLRERR